MKAVTLREIKRRCQVVLGRGLPRPSTAHNPQWCKYKMAQAVLRIVEEKELQQ